VSENVAAKAAKNSTRRRILLVLIVLLVVLPIIYCCALPRITGQLCIDYLSGHVPPRAEDIFLKRLFESAISEDYLWLENVATDGARDQLQQMRSRLDARFEVVGGDDLSGFYERDVKFENGTTVYLTYRSRWPNCPDFIVTEDEVAENMMLTGIWIKER
jgi:hypothetical protein